MASKMIEHRGVVQRVEGGQALVVMETAGCASCGQGARCGVGKMAAGRPATMLTVPVSGDVAAGDFVSIALPENQLTFSALLGYLFPAFAMLLGAGLGSFIEQGSDAATALGAIVGFVAALVLARIVIGLVPDWMPAPRLIPVSRDSIPFPKEHDHD